MNNLRLGLTSAVLAATAGIALGVPSAARADTTFFLGTPNTSIAGFPGPYEQVNVHLTDSTHAVVTFTSQTNSGNIYLMGDGGTSALNVSTTFSVTSITGTNSGTGFTTNVAFPGAGTDFALDSGNLSAFGTFNLIVDTTDGFSHSSNLVTIALTDTGAPWASSDSVLTANNKGFLAAAHVFITSSPALQSNGAIVTGFAGSGSGPAVPEPSTWAMMLLGFLGLGFAFRQSRRKVSFA